MPILECKTCGKEFYGKPCHIRMGYCKYCSRKCSAIAQRSGEFKKCFICGKQVWRTKQYLERSKSGNYFCSKSCQTVWRNHYYTGERHWNYKFGHAIEYRNLMSRLKIEKKCKKCGNQDRRTLAVHHVDKDRTNNKKTNLVYLCMNCHFLVHRYEESF